MPQLRLQLDTTSRMVLTLHPEMAERLKLKPDETGSLHFGTRQVPVRVAVNTGLSGGRAAISTDAGRRLRLPAACRFEVLHDSGGLRLGPYISFLVAYRLSGLRRYLQNLKDYTTLQREMGGAVLAFSLEGIDTSKETIHGYMYNPQTKKWVEGIYGYPSSIFIRGHVASGRWTRYFQKRLGRGSVFNDFYLNKWEMHRLLSGSPDLSSHLPASELYRKPADVAAALAKHSSIYIKPVDGTMGIGIVRGRTTREGVEFRYRRNGRPERARFGSAGRVKAFLERTLQPGEYLIQQAVPLAAPGRRMIDFRTIVVKNGEGQWEYMGMVARHGPPKSIVSNVSAGGYAERGELCLRRDFHLGAEEAKELGGRISELALKAAVFLEERGLHAGNLGVDIGVGRDGRLWIIEIQHQSPAHSIALDAGDPGLYVRTLRNNLQYMNRLAGFRGEGQIE